MEVIFKKYNLKYPMPPEIKQVDKKLFNMEVDEVMFETEPLEYWIPSVAKQKFLDRFEELNSKRNGN